MYNISIKSSFLIVVAAGCFLSVKAQDVQFQPLDSAYLADLEAMMLQTEKEQKAREVIQEYENKMLHRELAFHFDGLAEIIHGGINAWRNNDFYDTGAEWKERGNNWIDYGIALSPMAVTWGLKAAGVEARSKTKRMVVANVMAFGMTAGLTSVFKTLTDEHRPDRSDNTSMPSGHAALAFASATILHREYGHVSPWLSVAGYGAATTTEFLRLHNNSHWMKDIFVGAGIGTVAANFAYFLTDQIFGETGINRPRVTLRDMERTLQFAAQPSSFSLTTGMEWGGKHEDGRTFGSTFATGLEYSHFFDSNIAWDFMGRISTTQYYADDLSSTGTLDAIHLDSGIRYSLPVNASMRVAGRAFGGCRMLTEMTARSADEWNAECGAGIQVSYLNKEKYAIGVGCDYIHAFSSVMSNRFAVNMSWQIIL